MPYSVEELLHTTNLPFLPVLIPMLAAIILLMKRRNMLFQRVLSIIAATLTLLSSMGLLYTNLSKGIIPVFCAGGWTAPFGIVFAADILASIMVIMSSILSLCCLYFGFFTLHPEKERNDYYPLWQFLMMGVNGAFLTGDLFNLFVFFEVLLLASYALLVIGSKKAQLRETYKYLIINLLGSALFLIALGCIYSMVGTMNMADISKKLSLAQNQDLITIVSILLLVVFALKAAAVPFHFWLPQVHTVANTTVSAIFSGLLIKVGVYALIRCFTLLFIERTAFTHTLILILAAVTILLGVIGAVSQMNYKRILAYHSISQVGYMLMGLGLFTATGLAGAIYFTVHHAFIKGCLFLTSGVVEKITGTRELNQMGGLLPRYPVLGWLFFLAAASLAGIPPLSGFFGKFLLAQAAVHIENYWIVVCAIGAGLLTLFSMIKIFMYAYWGTPKKAYDPISGFEPEGKALRHALIPCGVLVAASLLMGLLGGPIMDVMLEAGHQLMNPGLYINTVLETVGGR